MWNVCCDWPDLLHDVGHGPFGHFFDEHYLSTYGLTHETLGSAIIEREFGDLIRGVRRNPNGALEANETLDPEQISLLITRPKNIALASAPKPPATRQPAALARISPQFVQRNLHDRQHGFCPARCLHVGLQHAGLRSGTPLALQLFQRSRA